MKKLLLMIMTAVLIFGTVSCDDNSAEIEAYKGKIAELEEKIEKLEGKSDKTPATSEDTDDGDDDESDDGTVSVSIGHAYTITGLLDFSVDSVSWVDELTPSNTEGVYSYVADKEDETYLVIRGKLTNLAGKDIDIEYMHESEVVINGKYTFDVTMRTEEPDGSSFHGGTKPLQTVSLVIYASVSDGVKDIFTDAEFTLNVLSDPEKIDNFFKLDYDHNVYTLSITKNDLA